MTSVRIVLAFNTENANKGFPYWHFDGILPVVSFQKEKMESAV